MLALPKALAERTIGRNGPNPPPASWKEAQLPKERILEVTKRKGRLVVCAEAALVVVYRPSMSTRNERVQANPIFREGNGRIIYFSLSRRVTEDELLATARS